MAKGKFQDLTGQRFGRLVVVKLHQKAYRLDGRHFPTKWVCLCDCGKTTTPNTDTLSCGKSKSCGCLQRESASQKTHGLTGSPEYRVWQAMRQRCTNPNHESFANYGGRGITVHADWLESFEQFLKDMGPKPTHLHTIERRDNQLGYSKANCEWATRAAQNSNTRRCRIYTFGGVRATLTQWCNTLGLNPRSVTGRLNRGVTPEQAFRSVSEFRKLLTANEVVYVTN